MKVCKKLVSTIRHELMIGSWSYTYTLNNNWWDADGDARSKSQGHKFIKNLFWLYTIEKYIELAFSPNSPRDAPAARGRSIRPRRRNVNLRRPKNTPRDAPADATSTARAYFAPAFFYIFFNAMPRHCNVNCTCCGGHRRRTSRLRTAYGGPQTPDAAWHACGRAEATSTARAAPTHAALCTRVHLFFFTHDAPAAPLGAALRVYVPPTVARNHPSQHRRVTRQRRVGAAWGRADATSTPRAYFAPAFFFSNATRLCPVTRLP